jgi:hypothetical protein
MDMVGFNFAFFKTDDAEADKLSQALLPEGRTWQVDNRWSVRSDPAHVPGMQDHTHIRLGGTEVAVISRDGTPSHNSDLSKIPNYVLDWIKKKGLTESYLLTPAIDEGVPADVVAEAIHHEELMAQASEHLSKTSRN